MSSICSRPKRISLAAVWFGVQFGALDFSAPEMKTPSDASNLNVCRTLLRASGPQLRSWREARAILTSAKLSQCRARPASEQNKISLERLLSAPPWAAVAGPRFIEIRAGSGPSELALYVHEDHKPGRRLVLSEREFLDQPLSGSATGRYLLTQNSGMDQIHLIDLDLNRVVLKLRSHTIDESLLASFSSDGKYLNVRRPDCAESYDLTADVPRLVARFGLTPLENDELRDRRGHVHFVPRWGALILHYHGRSPRWLRPGTELEDFAFTSPKVWGRDYFGEIDPEHRFLFSIRNRREIDIFSLPRRRYVRTLWAEHDIDRLTISSDGEYLAYASDEGEGVGVISLRSKQTTITHFFALPAFAIDILSFNGPREIRAGNVGLAEVYAFSL